MTNAIDLPIEDCAISVNVGADGVWLHFESTKGKHASIHVWNTLERPNITGTAICEWCLDREEQARQIRENNGQFGVGA